MTAQPLERHATGQGDRYLAAYAAVHSILEESTTAPDGISPPAVRSAADATTAVIPAARLARSTGGRRKMKRRRFRSVPGTATTTA